MKCIIVVAAFLLAGPAFGLNIRPTTRADHKSLDVVIRRLERAMSHADDNVARDIQASLYHLVPMRERRGGAIGWGQIELGSNDEADLICTQHGYANTYVERGEVIDDIYDGILNWVWNRIVTLVVGSIPWMCLAGFLYINRRQLKRAFTNSEERARMSEEEQIALRKKIEQEFEDREERRRRFSDPLIHRGHQRLKAEGKL